MYCPDCRSEYVDEITRCPDCGVEVVSELPELEGSDEPLRIVRIKDAMSAPMIEELLRNNGIATVLQGEVTATTIPAAGKLTEVRVWVKQSDAERADEIIEAFFESGDAGQEHEQEQA